MHSMTGFGAAAKETKFGRIGAEVRSVNNRFLELNFRLGSQFIHLEQSLRGVLRKELKRGKVDVMLRYEPSDDFTPKLRVNIPQLISLAEQVARAGYPRESGDFIRPEQLINVPGVVTAESAPERIDALDEVVIELVEEAARNLVEARKREGEGLRDELRGFHAEMTKLLAEIEKSRDGVVEKYRDRLATRIQELMGPKAASLDAGRLEQEVAIFADKADIAEECQRLASHLKALEEALAKEDEAVGRSLEFLSQEMLREVNTIGSKCRDLDIAKAVLELKNVLEGLREQIANIE